MRADNIYILESSILYFCQIIKRKNIAIHWTIKIDK